MSKWKPTVILKPAEPLLVMLHEGPATRTVWLQPPWEIPAACVMFWTSGTGWIPGPGHSLSQPEKKGKG